MAQEDVLIKFEVDYTELDNAISSLEKTGKLDPKVAASFSQAQKAISSTASDANGLINQFKNVASASVKMGKSVENAFGAGVQDALDEAGVSVEEFAEALKNANKPVVSLERQLRKLKDDLARLKVEGKDTGKQFDDMRTRAGKLADAIQDANAEIKNAGSDTRGIDNIVGSISALAGGYSALQGAAALFGDESEDLQKTLVKVNGAMALATGLQQTLNALQKEGSLTKLADVIATNSQSAAQAVYAVAVGTSTGAMKAFRIALLATGIGAIIVLLGLAAEALGLFGKKSDDASQAQDDLKRSIESVNESLDFQIQRLGRIGTEELARLKSLGASEKKLSDAKIKLLNDEIELSKQKEANLRTLAGLEKIGSDEAQALYKQANDEFYKQEDLKSKIKIAGYEEDTRLREAQLTAFQKGREELKRLQKEALDGQIEADKNYILSAIARVNKEIEQEQIAFDNKQEIEEQKREEIEKTKKVAIDAVAAVAAAGAAAGLKEVDDTKKSEEAKRAERIKAAQQMIQVGRLVADFYSQLSANATEFDFQRIDEQKRQLASLEQAGAITDKQARIRRQQIEIEERRAAQRRAVREKNAAVFKAFLAVPEAFLNGLSSGGPVLGAIYAALALAQAIAIASRPIPKFFKGKKDKYEGPGMVADIGAELVERKGRMYLYTKPTETYLGAQDKVYTAAETRKMLHSTTVNTTIERPRSERIDYNRLAKAIPQSNTHINIDKDFISEAVANGLSRNNYFTNRYQFRK